MGTEKQRKLGVLQKSKSPLWQAEWSSFQNPTPNSGGKNTPCKMPSSYTKTSEQATLTFLVDQVMLEYHNLKQTPVDDDDTVSSSCWLES
jgi:hypothetical protein